MNRLLKQLRHVGYVVEDLDSSVEMFRKLFALDEADIRYVTPDETGGQVAFAFISLGGIELEIIQPLTDIEQVLARMEKKGVRLGYITPDGVFDTGTKKIAYLNPQDTGGNLIELVEVTGA
jgi:hypothetical protein